MRQSESEKQRGGARPHQMHEILESLRECKVEIKLLAMRLNEYPE
jgi:hypothetical protein